MVDVTIIGAFIAGILSFLSPCILPIVPGFIAYLAGDATRPGEVPSKKELFLNSLFFVIGFSVIFAVVGVLLNSLLSSVAFTAQQWLARIGGVVIIFFGLYLAKLIKIKFLEKDHKVLVKRKFKSKHLTSFVFGSAFAVGWTPCVGAILGAILGLAASNPALAFPLLFAYALGLGIPFLLVGLFTAQANKVLVKWAKPMVYVNKAFGVILIILGILVFTQNLGLLSSFGLVERLVL
jgi:cytochrome c-type biogenesis protein